jgi:uncharacterized protein YcfJ
MKNLILITGLLLVSTNVFANSYYDGYGGGNNTQMEVVGVQPVYKSRAVQVPVQFDEEVCYSMRRNSQGVLEKVVDGGFGSTRGLVGTAAGVAIVDELGGNDAAKIIGGLLGNKIGNDFKEKKKRSGALCWQEQVVERQSYWAKTITGYKVDVELGDSIYTVRRKKEPYIGQYLPVRVSVQ